MEPKATARQNVRTRFALKTVRNIGQGSPWLTSLPGLVAYCPGRPTLGGGERIFTVVMLFESIAAIQAALGEAWREPVLLGDEATLVEAATVEHFERFG